MSRYLNNTPTWKSHPNPTEHYIPNLTPCGPRYTNHPSIDSIYIFADGSAAGPCPVTRRSTVAGYGVCYGPTRSERLYGQLESGPFDSSRAELRGLLAALEARSWSSEGSTWVGILGDAQSIYSTAGIIESLELNGYRRSAQSRSKWRKRNFKAGIAGGEELMSDLDLWIKVSARIRMLEERGTRVMFGWIPRKFNKEADRLACQGRNLSKIALRRQQQQRHGRSRRINAPSYATDSRRPSKHSHHTVIKDTIGPYPYTSSRIAPPLDRQLKLRPSIRRPQPLRPIYSTRRVPNWNRRADDESRSIVSGHSLGSRSRVQMKYSSRRSARNTLRIQSKIRLEVGMEDDAEVLQLIVLDDSAEQEVVTEINRTFEVLQHKLPERLAVPEVPEIPSSSDLQVESLIAQLDQLDPNLGEKDAAAWIDEESLLDHPAIKIKKVARVKQKRVAPDVLYAGVPLEDQPVARRTRAGLRARLTAR